LAIDEFQSVRKCFLELTPTTKATTPHDTVCKTDAENSVLLSCVPFCSRPLGPFERCVLFWVVRQLKPPEMANELKIEMTPFIWAKGNDVPLICGADF